MLGERHPDLSPVLSKEKSYSSYISILRDKSCLASQSGQNWYGDMNGRETVIEDMRQKSTVVQAY